MRDNELTEEMINEAANEAFCDMQSDLQSGECARIDSPSSGFDRVTVYGKTLGVIDPDLYDANSGYDKHTKSFRKAPSGVFRSREHALREISKEFGRIKFWGNVYLVNERGNVTLINPNNGKEIADWV